jgi:hypothetical protein
MRATRNNHDDRPDDHPDKGAPQADGLDNRWSLKKPSADQEKSGSWRKRLPGGPKGPTPGPEDYNRAIIRSTAFMLVVCLGLALTQPDALLAPVFAGYLFAAAGASVLGGLIARKPLFAPHLTHWDQVAFLLAVSLIAGFFTDPETAREMLEQLQNKSQ